VDIFIGDELVDTSPQAAPPNHEWNHLFVKNFETLEPALPIYISFVVS
jgi:hypothetical protein